MQYRALNDALETAGGGGVYLAFDPQAFEFGVEIGDDDVGQLAQVDAACLHDLCRICIIDEREQQMFKRRIFMRTVACVFQCVVKRCFQRLRK